MRNAPPHQASAFPAIEPGGRYHPQLTALRNRHASGVYAIIDKRSRQALYVGESHTGRLYDTITRHFRAWKPRNDPQGRRFGGTTYDRNTVLVEYRLTADAAAMDTQFAEIQRLRPRDNVMDGGTVCCDDEPPI